MTTSVFLAVRDAIAAKLMEAPAVAGGNVMAGWRRPIPSQLDQAVVLLLDGAEGRTSTALGGPIDWKTEILVEAHAKDKDDAEAAIDPLLLEVFERLHTVDVAAVGALDIAVSPLIEWALRESGAQHVCATLRVLVKQRTSALTLLAPE